MTSTLGGPSPSRADEDRHDWGMLALAWLLYFSFTFTVASLFPIVGRVREDLGLSYAAIGVVLGGWQLVYLVAAIPVGMLVDRVQPKPVLFVGTLLVAASQLCRSYADGFLTLFLSVALLGLGGPVMSVGLPKVVSEWFAGRHRPLAAGIYVTGAQMGHLVALAGTSLVVVLVGDWRVTLRIYAAVVVVIALVWLVLSKASDRTGAEPPTAVLGGLRHVVRIPAVWLIVVVGFSGFLASHGYRSWLPEMMGSKGMSATTAGLVAAVPALCGLFGSILIVRFGSRRDRRSTVVCLLAVVGAAMLVAAWATGPLLLVAVAAEGFCAAALMPTMMNALMDLREVGAGHMGAAAGLYFTVGEMGGFAGPAVIGAMVSLTGSFLAGILVLSLVMWAMIVPAWRLPA
ncbi:MFS transporter [Nocardioides sp. 503]|uniref:MFS transporter n=1 Tax=Nocardioides sp. 503 TaxID=2508326 RepID=UPI0010703B34|nr:MFS transporter [Nocardioides sp. 503]